MTSFHENSMQTHVFLDMFVKCVRDRPDAPAVVEGQCEYSYAQMYAWSAHLARTIRSHGVRQGDHVAVCAHRGAQGIAGLLAVLQTGAVYVPLNPESPPAMLAHQIQIANIRLVLLQASVRHTVADAGVDTPVETICDNPAKLDNEICPVNGVNANDPAYIIFTSGTTGDPKPVMVSLGNLFSHQAKMIDYFQLQRSDRVLQICSPSFDIYLEEVLPSLCAGACVVIAPDLSDCGIGKLNEFMALQAISLVNMPTALWCTWLDWLSEDSLRFPTSLTQVVIGSEACPTARLHQWLSLGYRQVRCVNAYGLTETTITTCAWEFPNQLDTRRLQHVPIGKALPGSVCYVLNEQMSECAPGESGELYVGGDGVSLGYLGDEEKTNARFIADPFSQHPGARLYRTGDQALLNEDGDLVVTGRVDRQIKLRGHRIEPEAIEHSLHLQTAIHQAVVCHCVVGLVDRLVAYLIPENGHAVTYGRFYQRNNNDIVRLLINQLKQTLPEYAIPTDFCFLERFPLTINDKIDYKALPIPAAVCDVDQLSGKSQILASCLNEVMGLVPEDLSGRFFDVGGDSIIGIKVVANLRRAGYMLSIGELMDASSLHEAAESIEPMNQSEQKTAPAKPQFITALQLSRSELQQLHDGNTLWAQMEFMSSLTPLQQGMVKQSLQTPRAGHYVEQVEGALHNLDISLFKKAWHTVARRHEILRTFFCFRLQDKIIQICNKQPDIIWHELNWMNRSAEQHPRMIKEFILNDRSVGFAFTNKPPYRLQLIQLDNDTHHFIWTYHHALLDGWSDLLILDEVFSLYYAEVYGNSCILPEPPSYRDYVDYLHSRDKSEALVFWREYFTGLSSSREWLVQKRTSAESGIAALEYSFSIEQTRLLNQHAQQQGVTLNTLFLAALGLCLGLDTSVSETVIGTLTAVRPEELDGVELTAGLFLNLLPARLRGAGDRPLDQWLQSLLHDQMSRRQHAYVSTDEMVVAAGSDRIDHLFNTVLIFENYPEARNSTAARLRNHAQSAFPLNFYIWPGEQLSIEVKYSLDYLSSEAANVMLKQMTQTLLGMPQAQSYSELIEYKDAEAGIFRLADVNR